MIILRLCAIAIVTAIAALILKNHKSDLVALCLIAGGIIMFLYAFDYFTESIEFIKNITSNANIDSGIVKIIFKILGISFMIELTAGSVKDLGFESVADKLVLCGKIIIFVVSVPILNAAYKIIIALINII